MAGRYRAGRSGRTLALDIPLGLGLGVLILVLTHAQSAFGGDGPPFGPGEGPPFGPGAGPPDGAFTGSGLPLPVSAYVGIAVAALGVMARRQWPRAALAITSAAVVGFLLAGNPPGPIMLLLVVVLFSAAAELPLRRFLAWGSLALLALLAVYVDRFPTGLLTVDAAAGLLGGLLLLTLPAVLGVLVRTRREAIDRGREEELRRYGYEERLRIAREVHDVVGHSLSVINMQAGVALHVLPKRPEQAAPSLEVIRKTSKEALEELRGTLAVFRAADAGADRTPLPGLARLEELVSAVSAEGRDVRLETGDPGEVPAAVDHAAYRIVQEALTNVVRHAGDTRALVRVERRPGELVIEVSDEGRARPDTPSSEGSGLAGMRERARAVGGTLRAGPRPEGGFQVRAVLPLGA